MTEEMRKTKPIHMVNEESVDKIYSETQSSDKANSFLPRERQLPTMISAENKHRSRHHENIWKQISVHPSAGDIEMVSGEAVEHDRADSCKNSHNVDEFS